MIGVQLVGGLGNQMFQYATARALALRHGTGVRLDLSAFDRPGLFAVSRPFELGKLNIRATPAGPIGGLFFTLARRRSAVIRLLSGWRPFKEGALGYNREFVDLPDRTYLAGYWQSWRYFADAADRIAEDFRPRDALSDRNRTLQKRMGQEKSVFVHVRRGDYVATPEVLAVHGVLGMEYYQPALAHLGERLKQMSLYIFSDDLEWCRTAFEPLGLDCTYVDWNRGQDSWQDMFLMAACKHGVVANSSFSWWGAWLGDQRYDKSKRMVVAPRRWFARGEASDGDRCPPNWTLL